MQKSSFYINDDFILGLSRDQGIQSSRIGLISNWVSTIQEKNIYFIFFKTSHHAFNKKVRFNCWSYFIFGKTGFNMIKEGVIGLAFRLVDEFFLVIRILGVVVRVVV